MFNKVIAVLFEKKVNVLNEDATIWQVIVLEKDFASPS